MQMPENADNQLLSIIEKQVRNNIIGMRFVALSGALLIVIFLIVSLINLRIDQFNFVSLGVLAFSGYAFLLLWQSAGEHRKYLSGRNPKQLIAALAKQKQFWKTITMLFILVLMMLVFGFMMLLLVFPSGKSLFM